MQHGREDESEKVRRRGEGEGERCRRVVANDLVARPGLLTAAGFGRPRWMWWFFYVGRGSGGVGVRVEKGHAGVEWLSYSEQCLVRRFALR